MDPVRKQTLIYMGDMSDQLANMAHRNRFESLATMFSSIALRVREILGGHADVSDRNRMEQ